MLELWRWSSTHSNTVRKSHHEESKSYLRSSLGGGLNGLSRRGFSSLWGRSDVLHVSSELNTPLSPGKGTYLVRLGSFASGAEFHTSSRA